MNFGGNYFSDGDELSQSGGFLTEDSEIDSQYGGYTSEGSLEDIDFVDLTQQSGGDEHEHEQQTAAILHHMNQENAEVVVTSTAQFKDGSENEVDLSKNKVEVSGNEHAVAENEDGSGNEYKDGSGNEYKDGSGNEYKDGSGNVVSSKSVNEIIDKLSKKVEDLPVLGVFLKESTSDSEKSNNEEMHKKYVIMKGLLTMGNEFDIDKLNNYIEKITLIEKDGKYNLKDAIKFIKGDGLNEEIMNEITQTLESLTTDFESVIKGTEYLMEETA
jgi:hypothetical protein